MLNNRLEDLIYKYKSYRIKKFIKNLTIISIFIIFILGFYSLYLKTTKIKKKVIIKKENTIKSNDEKNITNSIEKNITKKPKIIKVKKLNIDEDKILNQHSLDTLMILEKKKPTYQTALDLANYYFKNKNYQKASKWATVATNREPKNDKAWIVYAKSKIKLNQKGIAKKALKIYLLKYRSREISTLLNSI